MTASLKKIILVAVIAIAVVAAVASWKYFSAQVSADTLTFSGTVEADEIQVGSRVGGRIAAVLVSEGQMVTRDQPLVRFESFDLDARRADAKAAVEQAQANYEKAVNGSRPEEIAAARAQMEAARSALELARNGPRKEEIDTARAELEAAEADYQVAQITLARIERLTKDGVAARQDYDNAKAAFERAEARRNAAREQLLILQKGTRREEVERAERQFEQARANLLLVERGTRREDIEAAKAQLERARAALQQIETQVGELEVRAPADAFVEVMRVRPGDLINANSTVATLVEVDRLWVQVYVPEPELGHVQLDKEVSVYVDTFPNEAFRGTIEHIASQGEFTPRNIQTREERTHQVFGTRVRVDNSSRRLRAGMAADVVIKKQ